MEIIKQLDSDDARLVQGALKSTSAIPIVQIRRMLKDGSGYTLLVQHVLNLKDSNTGGPVENPMLPAMIDNWIRLGLVEVAYDTHLIDPNSYTWTNQRPEFLRLSQTSLPDEGNVECEKGIMVRIELGKRFAKAIGL